MTTMDELRQAAAAKRAEGVRATADRPSQRRCVELPDAERTLAEQAARAELEMANFAPTAPVKVRQMELREPSEDGVLRFSGYASVTDAPYEMWDMFGPYTELVSPGAFAKTLARAELDVPLVLQHQALRRIARTTNGTLRLKEDEIGLLVEADLDQEDEDVRYIAPKLRSVGDRGPLVDEMSFKFLITGGQWSPDWMEYHINEVDIHRGDVAIVGYGANPHTAGAGLRAADSLALVRGLDDDKARVALGELVARFASSPVAVTYNAPAQAPAPAAPAATEPPTIARMLDITDDDIRERVIA